MTIASLARRFDLKLHNTTPDNLRIARDKGIGFTENHDFKVQATVFSMEQD